MIVQIFLSAGAVVTLVVMAAAVREQQNNQQVEGIIQHLKEAVETTPTPSSSANEEAASPIPPIATPTTVPTRNSHPTPTPQQSEEVPVTNDIRIDLLTLPTAIQAGESFTVSWRLTGPSGPATGRTTLTAKYNVHSESDGSSSSVNSSNTQSYGITALPQTFSTELTYGSMPGTVAIEIEAVVNGKTVREVKSVQIN